MTKRNLRFFAIGFLATSAMSLLTGCGKTAFMVSSATQRQQAPGNFIVPPKVDILLAEDDTGSIKEVYGAIAQQVPGFLAGLESKGWDYHFATAALTTDRTLDQVTASKHDGNWGTLWQPPYPGALPNGPGTILSSLFRTTSQYTDFISYADTTNAGNGNEPGLETIRRALYNRAAGTNFLRPDAMLVVLVLGNGEDTSKVNYCNRGDGVTVPCESVGAPACSDISQAYPGSTCGSRNVSFNWYKSQLQALKASPSQLKVYSAVAPYQTSNCLGSRSYAGGRYIQMATETGGEAYDVCSRNISGVLSSLSSSLQATKLAMRTRYLFIDQAPEVSTIQVVKYVGGDASQAVTIPMDATNGWTYAGYVSNVYAIDSPVNMNLSSGYAIELHGSAKLQGEDLADVTYKHEGAQDSAN